MESNTNLLNTTMDESFNGTALALPLFIAYIKMSLLTVALPGILYQQY